MSLLKSHFPMHYIFTENNYHTFVFSGGEVHVELLMDTIFDLKEDQEILIDIKLTSAVKIQEMLLVNTILQDRGFKTSLYMGYVPYARQDRKTVATGVNALKHFANIINAAKFEKVFAVDPHSFVCENVFDNFWTIDHTAQLSDFVLELVSMEENEGKRVVFIAPDLGALKKVENYAKSIFQVTAVLPAHKVRDPASGAIKHITLLGELESWDNLLPIVVDDICDGGATFTELAVRLKIEAHDLALFVTHGIFSKGFQPLKKAGYKWFGTTDTFRTETDYNLMLGSADLFVYPIERIGSKVGNVLKQMKTSS